jgi:hypothetical protein
MIAVTPDGAILFRRPHYDIRSATPPFSLRNFLSIQSYFLPAVEDGYNCDATYANCEQIGVLSLILYTCA